MSCLEFEQALHKLVCLWVVAISSGGICLCRQRLNRNLPLSLHHFLSHLSVTPAVWHESLCPRPVNLRCHHRSGRGVGCHPFISRCLSHPCHSGKIHARYERIATGTAGAVALFGATGASKCCCFMGCLPGISMPGAGMTGWKMSRRWGDLEEHWIALDFRLRFLYFSGMFVTQMLKCLHENFGTLLDEDFLKGNCQHVEQSMDSELGRSLILSLWRTLRGLGCVLTSSVKWRNPSVMSSGGETQDCQGDH